jgi:hypothetical protein
MVKFLICGNLEESHNDSSSAWQSLIKRVDSLQKSSHGPFACLLVAGGLFQDEHSYKDALASSDELQIPAYAIDCPSFVKEGETPKNMTYLQSATSGEACGMSTIHNLTVCWVNSGSVDQASINQVEKQCAAAAYRGCDVFLSSTWPKNTHNFMSEQEVGELTGLNVALGAGSDTVTRIAVASKPRYHFCGGDRARAIFYARTPYVNPAAGGSSSSRAPATRMISLARAPLPIPDSSSSSSSSGGGGGNTNKADKSKKWVHALSLEPIAHLGRDDDVFSVGHGYTECPYLEGGTAAAGAAGATSKRPRSEDNRTAQAGEQSDKRFKAEGQGRGTGVYFFGNNATTLDGTRVGGDNNKRPPGSANTTATNNSGNLTPPSDEAVKLFIGNLPREYTDEQIMRLLPGSITIHRPADKSKPRDHATGQYPVKTFAFVEFTEHAKAARVVEASTKYVFCYTIVLPLFCLMSLSLSIY